MASREPPRCGIIIVNYYTAAAIERLLRQADLKLPDVDIILVDNGAEPEELQRLAALHNTRLLLLDRNYGFAGAVNRAVNALPKCGELLLLNPDVALSQNGLRELRSYLRDKEVTGVTPLLLNKNRSIQVGTAGGPPTPLGFASYFLFLSQLNSRLRGIFFTRRQLARGKSPAWLCMACLLLRGDAFSLFGAIPEDELVYAEDVAWGTLASCRGAKFKVVRLRTAVIHTQGITGEGRRWRMSLLRLAKRRQSLIGYAISLLSMWVGLAVRATFGRRIA